MVTTHFVKLERISLINKVGFQISILLKKISITFLSSVLSILLGYQKLRDNFQVNHRKNSLNTTDRANDTKKKLNDYQKYHRLP